MELVKKGYKKTEVGVIPEDWFNIKLNSIIDPKRTIRYGIVQPGKFDPNGKFLIRGQDYSNGWVAEDLFFRVSPQIEEPYKNARVIEGDVIITIVGASTGHVEIIPKWLNGSNLTQTTARLAIDNKKAINQYVRYYLSSEKGKEQVANYIKGAAQPGLNCGDIEKFFIPLPPTITEQKAIADALTDVDELITNLEKLIAKKKAIKQGAMQQLLTPPHKGGKRLEGFSGDWVEMRLGDIANFFSGGTPSTSNSEYYNGFIPWISSGELNNIRINQTNGFISRLGLENSSAKIVEKGTLLLAMYGATAGVCAITNIVGAINQAVLAIVPENYNSEYLFQFLRLNKEFIIKTYTQGGQPNLSGNVVKSIQAFFPASIEEQNEIANILFEMDLDIETLDKKLNKANLVKQGMMQELLTGKTRLI
jgi:type I restriction enzyme S subunit